jgi:hypothetical protein
MHGCSKCAASVPVQHLTVVVMPAALSASPTTRVMHLAHGTLLWLATHNDAQHFTIVVPMMWCLNRS